MFEERRGGVRQECTAVWIGLAVDGGVHIGGVHSSSSTVMDGRWMEKAWQTHVLAVW